MKRREVNEREAGDGPLKNEFPEFCSKITTFN